MDDSSHDQDHIYRVLYTALDIARTLPNKYDLDHANCHPYKIADKQ